MQEAAEATPGQRWDWVLGSRRALLLSADISEEKTLWLSRLNSYVCPGHRDRHFKTLQTQ